MLIITCKIQIQLNRNFRDCPYKKNSTHIFIGQTLTRLAAQSCMPICTKKKFVFFFNLHYWEKIRRFVFGKFVKTCGDSKLWISWLSSKKRTQFFIAQTLTRFAAQSCMPIAKLKVSTSSKANCHLRNLQWLDDKLHFEGCLNQ